MNLNDAIDLRAKRGLIVVACTFNGYLFSWSGWPDGSLGAFFLGGDKIEKAGSSLGGVANSWAYLTDDGNGGYNVSQVSSTGGDWPWLVQWSGAVVKERPYSGVVNIETGAFSMFYCAPVFTDTGAAGTVGTLSLGRSISAGKSIIKNGGGSLVLSALVANPLMVNSGRLRLTNTWTGTSANINGSSVLSIFTLSSASGVINVNDSAYLDIYTGTSGIVINLAANARFDPTGLLSGLTVGGITGNGLVSSSAISAGRLGLNLIQDCVFSGRVSATYFAFVLTNTDSSNTNNSPRSFTLTNPLNSSDATGTWGIGGNAVNASNRGDVVLKLGASNVIPDLVSLSIRGSSAATGNGSYQNTFDMNGFNETIYSLSNGAVTSTGTKPGLVTNNGSSDSILTISIALLSETFSGQIKDGSTNKISLVKSGGATQILSGSNAYSGGTRINAGILEIGNANGFGTSGNITFGGGTLRFGTGITADLASRIKNSASTMVIDTGSNSVTFASSIDSSNSGGLQKSGTGSLVLSGSNAFTGGVTLSAGTLVLNNNNAVGVGTLTLGISTGVINSTVSGISIGNQVTITANFTFTGTNNLSLTGNVTLTGSRTLTVSAGVLTMSGVVSGVGLIKAGSGTLTLSGASANTYTGQTSVTGGVLITTKCTSATASKFTQASFTPTALSVTFGTPPLAGETYRFFPGLTVQAYASITLVGAPGRTATYTSSTSTLTIA